MTNVNSTLVANFEAEPRVKSPVGQLGGRVRCAQGTLTIPENGYDADGDTLMLAPIPSNARILSIKIGNQDVDSGTDSAFNLGIYDSEGAVKDEDYFASAVTQFRAAARLTELFDEALQDANIADVGKELWEMAGDTEDPGGHYYIAITETATFTEVADAVISFQILYAID